LTINAKELLRKRYFTEDENSWADLCDRVSTNIAEQEDIDKLFWQTKFYETLYDVDFLPNSPTLMNAGTPLQYLSACMVLPIDDSIEGIFETVKNAAIVNKSGAGTGFSFSNIRPEGDIVNSTGGKASGPISFMKNFDTATETVKQGGRRKGANMGVLRVDHPDIYKFIKCKDEDGVFTNFNISVGITDDFMKAVEQDTLFDLVNPKTKDVWDVVKAKDLWDTIIYQAWKNGEPGVIFLDEINRRHPINEEIHAVNVCGEQPLLPNEQCTLGAINLAHMLKDGEIDWSKIEDTIEVAVRFLDNSIDANNYPVEELETMAKKYRKIGLGVMGWAEMLIKLGIPYNSEEAINLAEEMSRFINEHAIWKSEILGAEKGFFPGLSNTNIKNPRRNAVLTTVAPTGSRSQIANTSGGIEPFFEFKYYHRDKDGHITEFDYDFGDVNPAALVVAKEISPEWQIKMQAAWQKHIGSSISKTINMYNDVTVEEVDKIFKLAYRKSCKGITVYRDGSRKDQPLSAKKEETKNRGYVEPAMIEASGSRYKMQTGCGTMYCTVTNDEEKIIETFIETKNGGCKSSTEAMSRLISLALRGGIKLEDVVDQLKSVSPCLSYVMRDNTDEGTSCPYAVGIKLLKEYKKLELGEEDKELKLAEEKKILVKEHYKDDKDSFCPDCGNKLRHASGCVVCDICGWSKCG